MEDTPDPDPKHSVLHGNATSLPRSAELQLRTSFQKLIIKLHFHNLHASHQCNARLDSDLSLWHPH